MRILILDVETSGFDPDKDHLLEVAVVRWSVEHRAVIAAASWLLAAPGNAAEPINGIPPALLSEGIELDRVIADVHRWAKGCDLVLAHNGEFDRSWVGEIGPPWVDSAWDLEWPRAGAGRTLVQLALAHGLAVLEAHRALSDCLLLARLLARVGEMGADVGRLLERARRPKLKVISLAPFEDRELVKSHGFRWAPHPLKEWWRMMPLEDVAGLPFRCRIDAGKGRRP
jgi:DNA polymerase-3 subunit epsilon